MNAHLSSTAIGAIEANRENLVSLSESLHADPELAFEEHHAAALLTNMLREEGFEVTDGVGDLPTAFDATFGSDVVGAVSEDEA